MLIRYSWSETLHRLPRVLFGLVLFGVGIALMIEADLGLAPWDVFHQGLADLTGIPIGTIIVIIGLILLTIFIPLKERMGLGTILNAVLIGLTVDAVLSVISQPDSLALRALFMLAGPAVIAVGSGFYIGGGLGPGPRDGIMTGLARRGISVGKARTAIEVTVLIAGLLLGGGIGIGTLWFTFGIGPMVAFWLPRLAMNRPTPSS